MNEKIDISLLKSAQDKEEKEPGFARLEPHRKSLILNASATPPFDDKAPHPTEFYSTFLSKKSQFKAKDMLMHRLNMERVAFNPSASFIAYPWNSDFFWILPDSPSGVSVFYCPETKSLNSYELEKECLLALADKVKNSNIEKLSKQKLCIPTSVMGLVWMVQNFHSIISLCFGQMSHSAQFLKSWATHIYENRIMYTSLQTSDYLFYAKILFCIQRKTRRPLINLCLTAEHPRLTRIKRIFNLGQGIQVLITRNPAPNANQFY